MTAATKQRMYKVTGGATVAVSAALFASPFVLFAAYLIARAYDIG